MRQIPATKVFVIINHVTRGDLSPTCGCDLSPSVCVLVCRFVVSCVSCVESSFLWRWKFERQNPTLNILFVMKRQQGEEHVNLLLISNNETMHRLIRNLCRLLASLTKYKGKKFFCDYCMHRFIRQDLVEQHKPHCGKNEPQKIKLNYQTKIIMCYILKMFKSN